MNKTYGTHENLYVSPFLLTIFVPIYYSPPVIALLRCVGNRGGGNVLRVLAPFHSSGHTQEEIRNPSLARNQESWPIVAGNGNPGHESRTSCSGKKSASCAIYGGPILNRTYGTQKKKTLIFRYFHLQCLVLFTITGDHSA